MFKVAVIGGGAAGFFSAINIAENLHSSKKPCEITIFEANSKLLSKVLVSGGGRCNITNSAENINALLKGYPRGFKELREVFNVFDNKKTIEWFESRGVKIKTEPDGRVFPVTDNSYTIVSCLLSLADKDDIKILTNHKLLKVEKKESGFFLHFAKNIYKADSVVLSVGGSPRSSGYNFIENLGHKISKPIPSLFAFDVKNELLNGLAGLAVKNVQLSYRESSKKVSRAGDILITHRGLSGPAILKVSAFAAKEINLQNYIFDIRINWLHSENFDSHSEDKLKTYLSEFAKNNPQKVVNLNCPFYKAIPSRLWKRLCDFSEVKDAAKYIGLSKRSLNKLTGYLVNTTLQVDGKTSNKDEFVTCGGVKLDEVNFKTMESKLIPGLFFTGEVLDIDGITGGFNFQAAWSTAYIASKGIFSKLNPN